MNETKLTSARICHLGTWLATLLLSARLWAGEGDLLVPDLISITTDSAEPARERPISVGEVPRSSPTELSPGPFQFGPVIEVVLNPDVEGKGYLLDLDTGRVLTPAQNMRPERLATALGLTPEKSEPIWRAYLCGLGVDLINEDHLRGLAGCDLATAPVEKEKWDSLSAAEVVREADRLWEDTKPLRRNTMSWRGNSPVFHTFLFRTHEGNRGIFQITEIQRQPRKVKIRYKLARTLAERAGNSP